VGDWQAVVHTRVIRTTTIAGGGRGAGGGAGGPRPRHLRSRFHRQGGEGGGGTHVRGPRSWSVAR